MTSKTCLIVFAIGTFFYFVEPSVLEGINGDRASSQCEDLTSASVVDAPPCIKADADPALDETWFTEPKTWYTPLGHKFFYFLHAEMLLSRPASSYKELNEMCLTNPMWGVGSVSDIVGFGQRVTLLCKFAAQTGQYLCVIQGGSAGTHPPAPGSQSTSTIALTDNETYALILTCIDVPLISYWKLLTTDPTISPELEQQVRNKVLEMGFTEEKTQILSYNRCPAPAGHGHGHSCTHN